MNRSEMRSPVRTRNVAAVVKTMTHRDLKTAMHYHHPELDVVRTVLDYGAASKAAEMRVQIKRFTTPLRHRRSPAT
jgi:hypothetical protein